MSGARGLLSLRVDPTDLPTAAHVEAVFYWLPRQHQLPLLALDSSGARVKALIDESMPTDFDASRNWILSRSSHTTARRPHCNTLHPAITRSLEAHVASRPAGVDRLFPGSTGDSLRAAIHQACKEAGVPYFSPYRLRQRRIALLHAQGWAWEAIGEFVDQRFSTTLKTHTQLILDSAEVDYERLLRDC